MNIHEYQAKQLLTQFGVAVPAGDVCVTGIPIHPVFCERKDRAACLARHGLAIVPWAVLSFAALYRR